MWHHITEENRECKQWHPSTFVDAEVIYQKQVINGAKWQPLFNRMSPIPTSRIHRNFRLVAGIGQRSRIHCWQHTYYSWAVIQRCRSSCCQTRRQRGIRRLRGTRIDLHQRSQGWATVQNRKAMSSAMSFWNGYGRRTGNSGSLTSQTDALDPTENSKSSRVIANGRVVSKIFMRRSMNNLQSQYLYTIITLNSMQSWKKNIPSR